MDTKQNIETLYADLVKSAGLRDAAAHVATGAVLGAAAIGLHGLAAVGERRCPHCGRLHLTQGARDRHVDRAHPGVKKALVIAKAAKLSIRTGEYRGKPGFHVVGSDHLGRGVKMFSEHRHVAEHLRAKVAAGHDTTAADFDPEGEAAKLRKSVLHYSQGVEAPHVPAAPRQPHPVETAGPKPVSTSGHQQLHAALQDHGFVHHGEHPHILTGERGQLYQHSKDHQHFVHTQGEKWSSFHTDGKTTRLKKEGRGTTSFHLHVSGAMKDNSPEHPGTFKGEETPVRLLIQKGGKSAAAAMRLTAKQQGWGVKKPISGGMAMKHPSMEGHELHIHENGTWRHVDPGSGANVNEGDSHASLKAHLSGFTHAKGEAAGDLEKAAGPSDRAIAYADKEVAAQRVKADPVTAMHEKFPGSGPHEFKPRVKAPGTAPGIWDKKCDTCGLHASDKIHAAVQKGGDNPVGIGHDCPHCKAKFPKAGQLSTHIEASHPGKRLDGSSYPGNPAREGSKAAAIKAEPEGDIEKAGDYHPNVKVAESHGFHSPKPYGGKGGLRVGAMMNHPSGGSLMVTHSGDWEHTDSNGRAVASGHQGNLGEHLEAHAKQSGNPSFVKKSDARPEGFKCQHCEGAFQTREHLRLHMDDKHQDKVRIAVKQSVRGTSDAPMAKGGGGGYHEIAEQHGYKRQAEGHWEHPSGATVKVNPQGGWGHYAGNVKGTGTRMTAMGQGSKSLHEHLSTKKFFDADKSDTGEK